MRWAQHYPNTIWGYLYGKLWKILGNSGILCEIVGYYGKFWEILGYLIIMNGILYDIFLTIVTIVEQSMVPSNKQLP